jgi:acetolactate synthase regulatory subunit
MRTSLRLLLVPSEPTALQRVVVLCNGRHHRVVRLDYRRGDPFDTLELVVEGDPRRADLLRRRLEALVPVLEVHG